jgi:hypothetical protein
VREQGAGENESWRKALVQSCTQAFVAVLRTLQFLGGLPGARLALCLGDWLPPSRMHPRLQVAHGPLHFLSYTSEGNAERLGETRWSLPRRGPRNTGPIIAADLKVWREGDPHPCGQLPKRNGQLFCVPGCLGRMGEALSCW